MLDPAAGPFLFDTSAESWFKRNATPAAANWLRAYLKHHEVHVSSITVFERTRGYALLWRESPPERRLAFEALRLAYLRDPGHVLPIDSAIAVIAAEISALLPQPPTNPRRSHRLVESKQERLVRWRNDIVIAATALALRMTLLHNNAPDFETIRGAIERQPKRFPALGPLQLMRCSAAVT